MFGLKWYRDHLQNKANRRIIAATEDQSKHAQFVAKRATTDADSALAKIQSGRKPTERERKALNAKVLGRPVP